MTDFRTMATRLATIYSGDPNLDEVGGDKDRAARRRR